MCGIVGAFGRRGTPEVVARMSDSLPHRGPDDCGLTGLAGGTSGASGGFGHRRLAIIDLSASGHQPMLSGDGRWSIVFNGEIYNYRALRAELEEEGVRFRGGSDTEVILEGCIRYGPSFLRRLRGMYALAIWDQADSRAWLARDPFGIKPLYLAQREGTVLFASEVRALLGSGLVEPLLDRSVIAAYLQLGSVPEPHAIVAGVSSLPAGTVIEVRVSDGIAQAGAPSQHLPPFHAPDDARITTPAEAYSSVRAALRDSVAHHLIADVPVGMFLSGGIDSSAVVALAAEVSATRLDTFTVVFEERAFSEREHARAVANRFDTRHTELPLSGKAMLASLPAAFTAMDMPSMDGLNTYVVSAGVRQAGLKVVLSGLGGDELFAGYPSFRRASRLARAWPLVGAVGGVVRRMAWAAGPARAHKLALLVEGASPALAAYRASRSLFSPTVASRLAGAAARVREVAPPPGMSLLGQVSWYEATGYMRNTLLRDSDVFSMAHGLELRVPFVDVEVAAASMRIDDRLKLSAGRTKPLLVGAVEDLLPKEVWNRPKQGFALPFAHWLQGPLRSELDAAFTAQRLARVGIDPDTAMQVWRGFLAGGAGYTWSRPWAVYTLVRWAEELGASIDGLAPRRSPLPAFAAD